MAHEEAARFYEMALQSLEFADAVRSSTRAASISTRGALERSARWRNGRSRGRSCNTRFHTCSLSRPRGVSNPLELATASFMLLDMSSTEQLATEALELAERVQRSVLAADAMALLATYRQAQGDLIGAIEMHRSARARAGGRYTVA